MKQMMLGIILLSVSTPTWAADGEVVFRGTWDCSAKGRATMKLERIGSDVGDTYTGIANQNWGGRFIERKSGCKQFMSRHQSTR